MSIDEKIELTKKEETYSGKTASMPKDKRLGKKEVDITMYYLIKEDVKDLVREYLGIPVKKISESIREGVKDLKHRLLPTEEISYAKFTSTVITSALKSVAIGWLPCDVRPKAEEKILSDLEKKLLYKGTLSSESYTGISQWAHLEKGTKMYYTGEISAAVEGLLLATCFGYHISHEMMRGEVVGGILAGLTVGTISALTRLKIHSDECLILDNEHKKEVRHSYAIAGTLFVSLPISLAFRPYTWIKEYITSKKEELAEIREYHAIDEKISKYDKSSKTLEI